MTSSPAAPRIIAHRGASGELAEQTRAAYERAIDEGADAVECDVQLTRDGHVVCWHDWTVDRTSNGHGRVDEHSLAELRALDVTSWKGAAPAIALGAARGQFLTLAELWAIAAGAGRPLELAVETKQPSPAGAELDRRTVAALRAGGWVQGPRERLTVTLMSFDPRSVARLAAEAGPSSVCQLITTEEDLARDEAFAGLAHGACVGARAAIDSGLAQIVGPSLALCREEPDTVRGWIAAGHTVRVWTTNDADDARWLRELGVQEFITDWPARIRAAVS